MSQSKNNSTPIHTPVLVDQVLSYLGLEDNPGGTYVDATVSTGGHTLKIAEQLNKEGRLIGIDRDKEALKTAAERLGDARDKVSLFHTRFSRIDEVVAKANISSVDGMLFDFGLSTAQLDNAERGFAFSKNGPLDMRMDRSSETSARHIVNNYSRHRLEEIISNYGEEKWAGRIADFIVRERETGSIETTDQLARIVKQAIPRKFRHRRNTHPATKTFQALRIAVNDELEEIRSGLTTGLDLLKTDGVIVAISYHSLEDRIVKTLFKNKEAECTCPPSLPVCRCDKYKEVEILTPKPVRPTAGEIEQNPRARSAKLRAARKLPPSPR